MLIYLIEGIGWLVVLILVCFFRRPMFQRPPTPVWLHRQPLLSHRLGLLEGGDVTAPIASLVNANCSFGFIQLPSPRLMGRWFQGFFVPLQPGEGFFIA